MPHFKGDKLEADLSDGDIGVQCCSASHEVATRALQAIVAAANGAATLRWSQYGFIRDPLPGERGGTPRNIVGFKDGTNNLHADDAAKMRSNVWVNAGDGPDWMTNGTYVVVRNLKVLVAELPHRAARACSSTRSAGTRRPARRSARSTSSLR